MKQKSCKHQNIIIKSFSNYTIPQGYKWVQKQNDIDLADFYQGNDMDEIICADCNETLD